MKYYTKEWYELCQKISAHFGLEEAKEAEVFSEEYFHQLYHEKLNAWITSQEKFFNYVHEQDMSEEMKKNCFDVYPVFDRGALEKAFYERFRGQQIYVSELLPSNILEKIADIRVYALDTASREVIDDVTSFCKNNEQIIERTSQEYGVYFQSTLQPEDREVARRIGFHDCTIKAVREEGDSLTIVLDNSGGFTNIEEMKLDRYKIIKQDAPLEAAWWLYQELYKVDEQYELHALLNTPEIGVSDFIVRAENISFKENKQD